MIELTAGQRDAGLRLDVAVTQATGLPRSLVQAAIRSGAVTVGGRTLRPSYRLEAGDVISGRVEEASVEPPRPERIPLAVLYSDPRVLVVDKPPGLVTHPGAGRESGTLVNALLGLGGDLSREGSQRPGIVHRLDKETSGVLLVARDDAAHDFLAAELKERRIQRLYLALVRGSSPASGTIDAPLGRHPVQRRKMAVVPAGRSALTDYLKVAGSNQVSLLQVSLHTGRTHQIRVHLAHTGHPVLGDAAYGGSSELSRRLGLTRPGLHAWVLRFPHPDDGRAMRVTAPIPRDIGAAAAEAGLELPSGPW